MRQFPRRAPAFLWVASNPSLTGCTAAPVSPSSSATLQPGGGRGDLSGLRGPNISNQRKKWLLVSGSFLAQSFDKLCWQPQVTQQCRGSQATADLELIPPTGTHGRSAAPVPAELRGGQDTCLGFSGLNSRAQVLHTCVPRSCTLGHLGRCGLDTCLTASPFAGELTLHTV